MLKNNKKKFKNRGFYIDYSLIDPQLSYEYINEVSFMVRNIDKIQSSKNNIFEWKNTLDNKISYLLYIYIHIVSIPIKPFLDKIPYTLFSANFITYLLANNTINTIYTYINDNITYQVAFINEYIIDFISEQITYSYEILAARFFIYKTSEKSIIYDPFIYVNIDSNNNISNNTSYNTSKSINNFSFKLVPILINENYIYFKAMKQYIVKKISTIQTINNLTISFTDSTNTKLINSHINNYLYNYTDTHTICNCINGIKLASCYCTYIRHPLYINSQIDIGFKIGQIKNELINNIFH